MATLRIIEGADKGRTTKVDKPRLSVGRASSNDIVLHDESVSAHHAQVIKKGLRLLVRDLTSTNGTFVNELAITEKEVTDNDEVRMGGTVFAVTIGRDSEDEASQSVDLVPEDEDTQDLIQATISSDVDTTMLTKPLAELEIGSLRRDHKNLRALYRINQLISSTFDIGVLLEKIMDQIFDLLRAERGAIMLLDDESGELRPKVVRRGTTRAGDDTKISISRTIVNQVLRRGEGLLCSDAMRDERFRTQESIITHRVRSAMCAPLRSRDRVLGLIYLDSSLATGSFTKDDLRLLTAIANEAGVAIEYAKLHQASLQAERMAAIGEAVAGLSHGIKNILTANEGGMRLVQIGMDKEDGELLDRGWQIVKRCEKRISDLVMNMLSYSKEREPVYQTTDLNTLVQEIAELVPEMTGRTQLTVDLCCDPELPPIQVDPDGIHRAVLNLATNAVEAVRSVADPTIAFTTRPGQGAHAAYIEVSDNGCGIEDEVLPHIFDVFVSSKGGRGTGLGLAVSKKTVEEHQGKISVETELGKGTTFRIALADGPGDGLAPAAAVP